MRSARAARGRWAGTAAAVLASLVVVSASPAQADTIRSRQWHLDSMHAEEMWETSTGAGVTVAVIDTGVDASLDDLRGQVLAGRDFTAESGDGQTDTDGHGTHMAALIAATGKRGSETGSYGLAPGVKILPLRVGGKNYVDDTRAMVAALRYAAESDAKVINISLATPARNDEEEKAITYALSKGKMIIAGVGNTGDKTNMVQYPAAYPGVVGVAGLDQSGRSASWSQHGSQVDLSAPGVDAVSACPGDTEVCKGSGTSAASALTSASAALIWSVHPNWTANQVTRVLVNTAGGADTGEKRNDYVGYGAVRPRIALKSPGDPGPADVNPLPGPTPSQEPKSDDGTDTADRLSKHTGTEASAKGGGATKWIALGAGAAVLVGAAITTPILLSRRRKAGQGTTTL
ncbi:type VII secretion-associated serine protease mycosin [Streptomyces sp. NRRL B-1677]|uniref:type VII secretion-associated serine protease mycosin n=1 Tax=Streptomyces sp. NRRL B-1677 TaxID=2682966 RepID=UPI0018928E0C|nr:type VII secretion-associated serine protease mycosin [Streptomyces sp. NRRL B-1677]MBF6045169.1 type VII secretion-associated serine protease mycosin [Streptomyces sp. NRRL B-1677]